MSNIVLNLSCIPNCFMIKCFFLSQLFGTNQVWTTKKSKSIIKLLRPWPIQTFLHQKFYQKKSRRKAVGSSLNGERKLIKKKSYWGILTIFSKEKNQRKVFQKIQRQQQKRKNRGRAPKRFLVKKNWAPLLLLRIPQLLQASQSPGTLAFFPRLRLIFPRWTLSLWLRGQLLVVPLSRNWLSSRPHGPIP